MPRLRFTRAGAEAEAIRLASEFIAKEGGGDAARCTWAGADRSAPRGASSKHPVVWVVRFVFHPPEAMIDGGDCLVRVDLETKDVGFAW